MRKKCLVLLIATIGFQANAQDAALGTRLNVMQCSHEEVVAYMDLPNPERRAMNDFHKWQKAFKSTEITRSKSDPTVCLGTLYGDLGVMSDKIKASVVGFMSGEMPGLKELTDKALSKLSETICSRVNNSVDNVRDAAVSNYNRLKSDATSELMRRYGYDAMDEYVNDTLISEEFQDQGLRYRNGRLSSDNFRASTRRRWNKDLDELRDSAFD